MYDALDIYRTKKVEMLKYDAEELKAGDIVVVEAFVTRWMTKTEEGEAVPTSSFDSPKGKGTAKPRREWKKWNVDFRLESISVL